MDQPDKISAQKIVEYIDQQSHSLIYLRCHATQGPTWESSRLKFLDKADGWLPAQNINKLHLIGLPLVIVNACEAGAAQRMGSEKLGAFSRAFLAANASAFLGSLWKSPIKIAETFVKKILESSIEGDVIGEAVRKAREAHYEKNGMWAMFVLYGQTGYRIWLKAEPE